MQGGSIQCGGGKSELQRSGATNVLILKRRVGVLAEVEAVMRSIVITCGQMILVDVSSCQPA